MKRIIETYKLLPEIVKFLVYMLLTLLSWGLGHRILSPVFSYIGETVLYRQLSSLIWPEHISDLRLIVNVCAIFALVTGFAIVTYNLKRKTNS